MKLDRHTPICWVIFNRFITMLALRINYIATRHIIFRRPQDGTGHTLIIPHNTLTENHFVGVKTSQPLSS